MGFSPMAGDLIAGERIGLDRRFHNAPVDGPVHEFSQGSVDLVNQVVQAAEDAFWPSGWTSREVRATFLEIIADEIKACAEAITRIWNRGTGLPGARLQGERGCTAGQLRMFVSHIRKGRLP